MFQPGKKESDIKLDEVPKSISIISENINPIMLLVYFDRVYTKTSGMGMEALILGKEVFCYGMPCLWLGGDLLMTR